MKETIAIDIDDVLSPSLASFIEYQNRTFATELTREHFMEHDEYWGYHERALGRVAMISVEESEARYDSFRQNVEPSTQIVPEEVRVGLNGLKKWFDLQIITARDYQSRDLTLNWVDQQLPDVFSDVHFNRMPGAEVPKADICRRIGAICLIDDAPEHVNLAAKAGVGAILFGEYGWNRQHDTHPSVVRIPNWQETFDFVKENYKKP